MKDYILFAIIVVFYSLVYLPGCKSISIQTIGDVDTLEELFQGSNEIVIPKGVYHIDRTLYVPANKRVDARGSTFLLTRKAKLSSRAILST
jgi:hypothetical protein